MAITPPQRRTQEQRREETRAKLLDATIACLEELGYAGTTTREVALRAGVSAGAMSHHFPRRADLVAAAVGRLTEQRTAALREASVDLPEGREERVRALLDLLWNDFSSTIFAVFVKIWIAADGDPELYERMVPIERQLARDVATLVAELEAEFGTVADIDARVQTVLATLRGMALTTRFEPRHARARGPQWRVVRPVLERLLLAR